MAQGKCAISWSQLVVIVCLLCAVFLAFAGKDGWGWFLLVAALIS